MRIAFEADADLCESTDCTGRVVNLPSKHRKRLWLNRIDQRSANYGSSYHESKRSAVFEYHGESKRVPIKGAGLVGAAYSDKRNYLFITKHEHLQNPVIPIPIRLKSPVSAPRCQCSQWLTLALPNQVESRHEFLTDDHEAKIGPLIEVGSPPTLP